MNRFPPRSLHSRVERSPGEGRRPRRRPRAQFYGVGGALGFGESFLWSEDPARQQAAGPPAAYAKSGAKRKMIANPSDPMCASLNPLDFPRRATASFNPCAAANGGGPSRLQSARPVAAVAELGSFDPKSMLGCGNGERMLKA